MKKLVLISLGCLLAVAGVAAAEGRGHCGGPGMRGGEQLLEKADTNHDGRVTRQEMTDAATAQFRATDANHDGRVTQDELRAAFDAKKQEHFASKDKNGDGKLSADEVKRMPAGFFAKLDTNHDGSLSKDELASFGPGRGGEHDGSGFFKKLDTNGDNAITADEAAAAADERFERMDKNGDKVIDASELSHRGGHWQGHYYQGTK